MKSHNEVPFPQMLLLPFICRFVLRELIETEKMYVEDLGQIVEVPASPSVLGSDPLPLNRAAFRFLWDPGHTLCSLASLFAQS